jgi:hypothetical protein
MERNLFDTASMLGLDVMFVTIAALSALSALAPVLQSWRDRMTSNEAAGEPRPVQYDEQAAGYAPPLSTGFMPGAQSPAPSAVPAWIEAWTQRNPPHDGVARQGARPTTANRGESPEDEAA